MIILLKNRCRPITAACSERGYIMISSSYDIYFDKMDTYLDLRDLSLNTRKIYHSNLRSYFRWLSETLAVSPDDATFEHIRSYLLHLKHNRKLTNHSINSHSSTIRFFRLFILKQTWNEYDVPRMKYNTPLPFVLSKNDTLAFINSIPNLKHKAFIVLLYSAGLRLSEVATLRWEDIQRKDQRIFIRASKNRKERYALLSSSAITILEIYWRTHGKPMKWLFPGRNPDSPISKSTGANYIKRHLEFLGWTSPVSAHTFRHCFATHLYEQGEDLISIKEYLGHSSINSTTLYVQLARKVSSKPVSPFDVR